MSSSKTSTRSAPSPDSRITECAGAQSPDAPAGNRGLELTGRSAAAGNLSYYPPGEHVPAHPELRRDWEPLITQTDKRGRPRTVRMAHEAATFRELQERLRCKEIWVVGAAAIAAATGAHGEGGSKMRGAGMAAALTASDAELFGSPAWMTEASAAFRAMFAQGLEGYADDRLADGAGWGTFDVASIRCPVTVLHGRSDRMVDVIHAHHTAELIPGANLVIFDDLGHFSITTKVVPAIRALLQRQRRSPEPGRFPAMSSRDIP